MRRSISLIRRTLLSIIGTGGLFAIAGATELPAGVVDACLVVGPNWFASFVIFETGTMYWSWHQRNIAKKASARIIDERLRNLRSDSSTRTRRRSTGIYPAITASEGTIHPLR